nr:photosystem I subunit XII [Abies sibirica]AGL75954.1 photosystem I subunit XII [Abies sibirica subsp. semenovii]AGL75958.1 photosystem I subunit XII [Abies nephrolepis]AGL75962.1 photosystem I subunit XII [Abies sachalinensis]AGL75966.1 photosystem I subunit XII [Abies sachalinensis var. gracilis]AGL75970.1 photosystem I subunit XII [Abies koreana]AGL75972.1 photosystem I subunit XII [Abies veitchii]AGL75975.1 photosystem I subunit XII [Abies chensiensis]AGL75977.1 photosystem I subunit 
MILALRLGRALYY